MSGRLDSNEALRLAFAGQIQLSAPVGGEKFIRLRLLFPVEIVRRRDRKFRELRELRLPDRDDAVRLRIIERLEQHAIHAAENPATGPEAERGGENGEGGEARGW